MMMFTYDPQRRVAIDPDSNSTLERTSQFTDSPGVIVYRFTNKDLVVDFEILSIDEQRPFKWKGSERLGWVHVLSCIVEPTLRRSYFRAVKLRPGLAADEQAYEKFRDVIERAVFVLATEGSEILKRVPEFRVKFVQGYEELKKQAH
jgi:hypothetical protein